MRGSPRPGFTLFEVLLSLAIAVLLLAAVYSTIGYQLQNARAGREVMERSTLSRSLFTRMSADIMSASTLNDPGRYRRLQSQATGAMASTGTGTGSGSASGTTTGTSMEEEDAPPQVPIGIIGTSNTLTLFVTKVPGEVFPSHAGEGRITCDLRRISYWLASDGGLCRMEAKLITSQEALNLEMPGDAANYRIAPEVKSLEISYFDGTDWASEWDSTATDQSEDGVTPLGPPRAIAITIGFLPPSSADGKQETELKYLRHVVLVPTGNGLPQTTTTP